MIDYRVPMGVISGVLAFLIFLEPAGIGGALFISVGGVALWAGIQLLVDFNLSKRASSETE